MKYKIGDKLMWLNTINGRVYYPYIIKYINTELQCYVCAYKKDPNYIYLYEEEVALINELTKALYL